MMRKHINSFADVNSLDEGSDSVGHIRRQRSLLRCLDRFEDGAELFEALQQLRSDILRQSGILEELINSRTQYIFQKAGVEHLVVSDHQQRDADNSFYCRYRQSVHELLGHFEEALDILQADARALKLCG